LNVQRFLISPRNKSQIPDRFLPGFMFQFSDEETALQGSNSEP